MKNFCLLLLTVLVFSACQETDPAKRIPKSQRAQSEVGTPATEHSVQPRAASLKKKGEFPDPLGFVSDYSGIFTDTQRELLERVISAHQEKTTNEIAVVTIRDISPYTDIFEYTFDLANTWGVGVVDKNNGVVVVLNDSLGMVRINTGLGTEKILVDKVVQEIIDSTMIPKLKEQKLFEGMLDGTKEIIRRLEE